MNENEIDAIIAQAMQEYTGVSTGTNASPTTAVPTTAIPTPADVVVDTVTAPFLAGEEPNNGPENEASPEEFFDQIMREIDESNTEEEHVEGTIPENPRSLEVDDTNSRFRGAEWFADMQNTRVTIAGVGGIGSYTAFLISRLKPNSIDIFDDDTVEEGNLSGQLYGNEFIGRSKVGAIGDIMYRLGNYTQVYEYTSRFNSNSNFGNILICGFDSMEARKVAFNNWYKKVSKQPDSEKKNFLFIDGRLAAEEFQVFCFTGDNDWAIKNYKKNYLFDDSEADEVRCSYKQTSYMANMIGTVITNLLVNFVYNKGNRTITRVLPFLTEYSAETMLFKVSD